MTNKTNGRQKIKLTLECEDGAKYEITLPNAYLAIDDAASYVGEPNNPCEWRIIEPGERGRKISVHYRPQTSKEPK